MGLKFKLPYDIDSVWQLISNTEQTNRAIGFSKVEYDPVDPNDTSLCRKAHGKMAGMKAVWVEHPFQWRRNSFLSVLRVYERGLFKQLTLTMRVSPASEATTNLEFELAIKPRHFLLTPVILLIQRGYARKVVEYINRAMRLRNASFGTAVKQPVQVTPANIHYLDKCLQKVTTTATTDAAKANIQNLRDLIVHKDDLEVAEIRPLALAAAWKSEQSEVIRLFCEGTKSGLLDARWSVVCPNCRVTKGSAPELKALPDAFHCDMCGIDIASDLSANVELKFRPSEAVRSIDDSTYCIGSPSNTEHIASQVTVAQGQVAHITPPLQSSGTVDLRVLKLNHRFSFTPDLIERAKSEPISVHYQDGKWVQGAPLPTDKPGISITNDSAQPIVVALETTSLNPYILTAVKMLHFGDFRQLFATDALTPGRSISVKALTVLFTDLVGSTSMYESIGDATAYGNVQRHFDFLTAIFQKHGGKIVKTIGDAVLATFPVALDGVRAAIEVQEQLPKFNASQNNAVPIRLRIGLHTGPVIAVEANDKVDYFGRTMNIASRVEHAGIAGAVILSADVANDADVQDLLKSTPYPKSTVAAQLKGIDLPVQLTTIEVNRFGQSESVKPSDPKPLESAPQTAA